MFANISWKINNGSKFLLGEDHGLTKALWSIVFQGFLHCKKFGMDPLRKHGIMKLWIGQPRRPLRNREIVQCNGVKGYLIAPQDDKGIDRPIWKLDTSGTFKISSIKEAVYTQSIRDTPSLEPNVYKNLWKSNIPKQM